MSFGVLQLLIIIISLGILVLPFIYIYNLQNIIKQTKAENRYINPTRVWFVLIPIVGVFIHINNIQKITKTIEKDLTDKKIKYFQSDIGKYVGLIYSILGAINAIIYWIHVQKVANYFEYFENLEYIFIINSYEKELNIILGLLFLIQIICWILYWIKINKISKKLHQYNNFHIKINDSIEEKTETERVNNQNANCNNCKNSLNINDKFCSICGLKNINNNQIIIDIEKCPECNCDRLNNEDDTCLKCGFPFNDNLSNKSNNNMTSFLVKSCPDCNNTRLNNVETCLKCGFPFDDSQNQVSNFQNTDYVLKNCPECKSSRNNNEETCSKCSFPFVEVQINKDKPQKTPPFADNKLESVKSSNEQLTKNQSFFQKPLFWIIVSLIFLSFGIFFFWKNSNEGLNDYANDIIECELLKQELLKENIQDLSIRLNSNEFNSLDDFNNYIEQQNLKLVSEGINNCETEIKKSIEDKDFSPKEMREIRKLAKNHSKSNLIESLKSNNIKRIGYLSNQAETKFESKKKKLISLSEIENQPMDDGYNGNEYSETETNYNNNEDNVVHEFVEVLPNFPGGQFALEKYINKNLKYPQKAIDNQIYGTVFLSFIIERDGSISNVRVIKGISDLLNEEAIRLVEDMPNWIPGKNNLQIVRTRYTLPIDFSLK